jgi:hypothetical protein
MREKFGHEIWPFLRRHPIIALGTPLVIVLTVQATRKMPSEWILVFVESARTFLDGGDIYGNGSSYFYPPFMALLFVPFVPVPELASRLLYLAINIACIAGLVRAAWVMSGGAALNPVISENRSEWAIAGIGLACSAPFAFNALAHMQVDLFIDALVATGCLLLLRGQKISGPVLIGLAAAFKGPPLLFAAYLAFRRNWVSAGVVAVVALGLNLLPDLLIPSPDGRVRVLTWFHRFVVETLEHRLGTWDGMSWYNQSIAGSLGRLLTTTFQITPSGPSYVADFQHEPNSLLKVPAYLFMLMLLAASIIATARGQIVAPARPKGPRLPSLSALEISAVSLLMLLISPMSHVTHLGILILPAFCLGRIAISLRDRVVFAALIVAAAAALANNKDLVGETVYTFSLWSGFATLGMLALLAGCLAAMALGECEPPVAGLVEAIIPLRAKIPRPAATVAQSAGDPLPWRDRPVVDDGVFHERHRQHPL